MTILNNKCIGIERENVMMLFTAEKMFFVVFLLVQVPATSSVKGKKNGLFSPMTGTCLLSAFSSPRSNHVKEQRNDLSDG